MREKKSMAGMIVMIGIFAASVLANSSPLIAQTEQVLYTFAPPQPNPSNVTRDPAGNLFGATPLGGTGNCEGGCGTVFELTPSLDGTWVETILHNFQNDPSDGVYPGAVVLDAAGNLFGTTGGSGGACFQQGIGVCGTVFELSPQADGKWRERILHNFTATGDGRRPTGIAFDAAGNLFGITQEGGAYNFGMVFELSPHANGKWEEEILHSFNNDGEDGYGPLSAPVFDSRGNLYGATLSGGNYQKCHSNCGVIYELTRNEGSWSERILHTFGQGHDAYQPLGGLTFDSAGNLYGVAQGGGYGGWGTIFELVKESDGGWAERLIWSFGPGISGGGTPAPGLAFDAQDNLYGETYNGGTGIDCASDGCGTIFELISQSDGKWSETVLVDFSGTNPADGENPDGGLIIDAAGNLYGITYDPAVNSVAFEITP